MHAVAEAMVMMWLIESVRRSVVEIHEVSVSRMRSWTVDILWTNRLRAFIVEVVAAWRYICHTCATSVAVYSRCNRPLADIFVVSFRRSAVD